MAGRALFLLLVGVFPALACPPGLERAAAEHRVELQRAQDRVRDSSLESPEGIEETVQFDLAAHACHRGPGQAYREYGPASCLPAAEPGLVPVRYGYRLFFRRALTLEGLFGSSWEAGSGGAVVVTFQEGEDGWHPVGHREVLDLGAPERPPPLDPRQ